MRAAGVANPATRGFLPPRAQPHDQVGHEPQPGAYSPPLDATGNSLRSIAMLEALSSTYGLHMFAHPTAALEPAARELLEAARASQEAPLLGG